MPTSQSNSTLDITLYQAEAEHAALLEAAEEITPELEERYKAELEESVSTRGSKREAAFHFALFLKIGQENADREIKRITAWRDHLAAVERRYKRYLVEVIKRFGVDVKGKYRKIDADSGMMFLRALPSKVDVQDEDQIPDEFKTVLCKLPLWVWQDLASRYEHFPHLDLKKIEVDTKALEDAMIEGQEVSGADLRLAGHDHTVVIK